MTQCEKDSTCCCGGLGNRGRVHEQGLWVPLEAGGCTEMDSLEAPEGTQLCRHLDLSEGDPFQTSELQHWQVALWCSLKFVVICSAARENHAVYISEKLLGAQPTGEVAKLQVPQVWGLLTCGLADNLEEGASC